MHRLWKRNVDFLIPQPAVAFAGFCT